LKAARKEYREANKEKLKAADKEYRETNKEKRNAAKKEYHKSPAKNRKWISELLPIDGAVMVDGHIEVKCYHCRKQFAPTNGQVKERIKGSDIKGKFAGQSNFYCSNGCKDSCPVYGHQARYIDPRSKVINDYKFDQNLLNVWAQDVKKRDNYTCQGCGAVGVELHAHHIEPKSQNPIMAYDLDNGVSYCSECHSLAHSQDGCRLGDLMTDNCRVHSSGL